MPRVTKTVEERRQEIIDAAKTLFLENGFDKTQVADISKKMNIAQGLIYRYFMSKTELLYAVIDVLSEEHVETVQEALAECKGSAIECLSTLFRSEPKIQGYKTFFASIGGDRGIIEYCGKKMKVATLPLLISLIERGNADGSWGCEYPAETAAFILQGISGIFELTGQGEQRKKEAFTSIIYRLLNVKKINGKAEPAASDIYSR